MATIEIATVQRELKLPVDVNTKLRQKAVASGTSIGATVARLVADYADGVDVKVTDPGANATDKRTKFVVPESTWEQARIRAVMDETSVQAAIRRLAIQAAG